MIFRFSLMFKKSTIFVATHPNNGWSNRNIRHISNIFPHIRKTPLKIRNCRILGNDKLNTKNMNFKKKPINKPFTSSYDFFYLGLAKLEGLFTHNKRHIWMNQLIYQKTYIMILFYQYFKWEFPFKMRCFAKVPTMVRQNWTEVSRDD